MQSAFAPMRSALQRSALLPQCSRASAAAAAAAMPRLPAAAAAQPCRSSFAHSLSPLSSLSLPSLRRFHSTPFRRDESVEGEAAEPAEPEKRDQEEIQAFLDKLKLGDYAEKFDSFGALLNTKSRELKAMGLTVKQRKTLRKLLDRYVTSLRVRRANAMIYALAHKISPEELQARVYRVMYGHIYNELDWRDENRRRETAWRAQVQAFKDERRWEHNDLRGLREPELQEMAKLEARLVQWELKEMQDEHRQKLEEEEAKELAARRRQEELAAKAAAAAAAAAEDAEKIEQVSDEEVEDEFVGDKEDAYTDAESDVVDATAEPTPEKKE